jgi:hypothetical protein
MAISWETSDRKFKNTFFSGVNLRGMKDFFQDFPPQSRVWVYQADQPFPKNAAEELQPVFDAFASSWTAHKQQLKAEIRLVQDYFIVVMVDEDYHQPSGCGIDASVHFIKDIGKKYGIELFDRMRVCYIEDGEIKSIAANELVNRLHAHEFTPDLVVFNSLVQCKDELLHEFTKPLKDTWLKKYL